jgi:hypothetical protein
MQATYPSTEAIEAGDQDAKEWWFRIPKHAGPDVERHLLEKVLLGLSIGVRGQDRALRLGSISSRCIISG